MKKHTKLIGLFIGLCVLTGFGKSPQPNKKRTELLRTQFKEELPAAIKAIQDKEVNVSVVISTTKNQLLYFYNGEVPMIPASTQKILTTYGALKIFGPNRQFHTDIHYDGTIQKGILEGDLYVKGYGDLGFSSNDLKILARKVYDSGIWYIRGNIVVDSYFFDQLKPKYRPNARHYFAASGPLNLDYNIISLKVNDDLSITPAHRTTYVKFKDRYKLTESDSSLYPKWTYTVQDLSDTYELTGKLGRGDIESGYLSILASRPDIFFGVRFEEELRDMVTIDGQVKYGLVTHTMPKLFSMPSRPLKSWLYELNHNSNNGLADGFLLLIGSEVNMFDRKFDKDLARGAYTLKQLIKSDFGIGKENIEIVDGSGLSHDNRTTAQTLVLTLNKLITTKHYSQPVLKSLGIQGDHATASTPIPSKRFKVLVKTGTLSVRGVNNVVGYIFDKKTNNVFTFAIMTNRKEPGPYTPSGELTTDILAKILEILESN